MQNADTHTVPLTEHQKVVQENQELKQRLAWYERMMFGQKSERFVPKEPPPGQLIMAFDPALGQAVRESVTKLIAAHERKTPEPKKSEHKGRVPIPDDLPRVEEVIQPDEDVTGMKHIGDDVTEVLEFEAGRIWVRRIVRPRYARPETSEDTAQPRIVQAPAKELPFGRFKAGASLIAHILTSKYVEHLPLHRLIARFTRSGLKIPPATMGHWVKAGAEPLYILYDAYQELIFRSKYLQMDETSLRVLEEGKGKTHLGYMWAVFDPVNKLPFFFYRKGRDHKGAKELLANFAGVLQSDGFSVYETLNKKLDELILMNCMSHVRRGFFDARNNDYERAHIALTLIKLLYAVEEKARSEGMTAEQRLTLRLVESKTIFDTLGQWLQTEYDKVTPASTIGKAIQYALNRWKNLGLFLTDGQIEIDNNLVENTIRPIAIGRKNYLFAGSHESARRKAVFYTLFAACKHHNVDPEKWLNYVFNHIQDHKVSQLHELMPQNWKGEENNNG